MEEKKNLITVLVAVVSIMMIIVGAYVGADSESVIDLAYTQDVVFKNLTYENVSKVKFQHNDGQFWGWALFAVGIATLVGFNSYVADKES